MKFSLCGCGIRYLVRMDRTFWMRLVPGHRHYYCVHCKAHLLLSRRALRAAFPQMHPELDAAHTVRAALD
jgi:hypothetical protein